MEEVDLYHIAAMLSSRRIKSFVFTYPVLLLIIQSINQSINQSIIFIYTR